MNCCENPENLIEIDDAQSDHGELGINQKYYCKECYETWYYYSDEFDRLIEEWEKKL
jgi:hypothetical protein